MPKPPPFDAHDDQERAEILTILKELPETHPARAARAEGADGIRLTHLMDGRKDLIRPAYGGLAGWLRAHDAMFSLFPALIVLPRRAR